MEACCPRTQGGWTAAARLQQVPADKFVVESLAQAGGRALDDNTSALQSLDLGIGTTLTSRHNSSSVAHATAWGCGDASDETDNRLTTVDSVVLAEEIGSVLLCRTADLANHDDTVGFLVLEEDLEAVDEVGAREGIATNADNKGLAQTSLGGLVDGLVGQGARTGDDTNATALVDETRHDADLALAGSNDAGAVGADKTGLGLSLEHGGDAHHVYTEVRYFATAGIE